MPPAMKSSSAYLEDYVGMNWKSHYRATFSRLLDQKLGGDSGGYPTVPAD